MNIAEWSVMDWFVRLVGISIIFSAVRLAFSKKELVIQTRRPFREATESPATPRQQTILRVGGVFGMFLGTAVVIYGTKIFDVLFPWLP